MIKEKGLKAFAGDGKDLTERQEKLNDPVEYYMDENLRSAVQVALMLGLPLLVTGKPGTGKTQLAKRVALELGLKTERYPLTFFTKSTSTARDLFYHYDALRHFRDSQVAGSSVDAEPYITYEALGLAILLSLKPTDKQRVKVNKYLPENLQNEGPLLPRPVVLIDEIDKAPRDFPNDLLNEIEGMSFTVKEVKDEGGRKQGLTVAADPQYRPVVIITSNSERDLPDAFLRRCIFYHIELPDENLLKRIVAGRLGLGEGFTEEMRDRAIKHFLKIRDLNGLDKMPATAELLAWMRVLEIEKLDVSDRSRADELKRTYVALGKSDKDLNAIREALDKGDTTLGREQPHDEQRSS
jgi:MoxR-like ATPase